MKKKLITALLFITLTVLPALMIILYTYTGSKHPAEQQRLQQDGFLKDSPNQLEIIFFGYAGCDEVCPATLGRLSLLSGNPEFKNLPVRTGVYFVDIKREDPRQAQQYATGFSEKFRSYTPGTDDYRALSEEFILRVYKNRDQTGRISHTDHLFILKKVENSWVIQRVLKNEIRPESLLEILRAEANPAPSV